eukprot:CAMPEP_0174829962 /NCGR_PEP_ID=MMETSP1114-20130205/2255_1 /TAXON_ID=312471 /ORGANISM="Neobodo designis, Strain CCAP 1951/1" /LENGTH=431 /DNA_ID=CAMNT_0016063743 /DNA_START=608 /DNA_END=1903 /DNA_ORIENTATION=-
MNRQRDGIDFGAVDDAEAELRIRGLLGMLDSHEEADGAEGTAHFAQEEDRSGELPRPVRLRHGGGGNNANGSSQDSSSQDAYGPGAIGRRGAPQPRSSDDDSGTATAAPGARAQPAATVLLTNVPRSTSLTQLRILLGRFGAIKSCKIRPREPDAPLVAIATFFDAADAVAAVASRNSLAIDNKPISATLVHDATTARPVDPQPPARAQTPPRQARVVVRGASSSVDSTAANADVPKPTGAPARRDRGPATRPGRQRGDLPHPPGHPASTPPQQPQNSSNCNRSPAPQSSPPPPGQAIAPLPPPSVTPPPALPPDAHAAYAQYCHAWQAAQHAANAAQQSPHAHQQAYAAAMAQHAAAAAQWQQYQHYQQQQAYAAYYFHLQQQQQQAAAAAAQAQAQYAATNLYPHQPPPPPPTNGAMPPHSPFPQGMGF